MTMDTQELLPELDKVFEKCEMLEGGVARCEHRYEGKLRSIYFVKAVDNLPQMDELNALQTEVIAPSYFATNDESRWNHYLILVTSQERIDDSLEKRSRIEANTNYARKIVLATGRLRSFLDRRVMIGNSGTSIANTLQQTWSDILSKNGLAAVDSEEPRVAVVKSIRHGDKLNVVRRSKAVVDNQPITFLKNLDIRKFGERKTTGQFEFARVNLIRGVNGSGKTSLLEAIEHFFCGGTARAGGFEELEASAMFSGIDRKIEYKQRAPSYYIQRDLKWYGRKASNRNRLFDGFARYNFLSADAAVDFSRERDQHNIAEVLSRVALGPDASATWNRINQFHGDILPVLGQLEREINAIGQRVSEEQARLSVISKPSPEIQSRFIHVKKLLQELGWPTELLTDDTKLEFSGFGSIRVVLDNVPDPIPSSLADAMREIENIQARTKEIADLEELARASLMGINRFERSLHSLDSLTRALRRLSEYESAKFHEIYLNVSAVSVSTQPVADRSVLLDVRTALLENVSDGTELLKLPMGRLAVSFESRSRELRQAVDALDAELKIALTRTEYNNTLTAQLRSIGLQLVKQYEADHCPLCRTAMSHEELLNRIETLLEDQESEEFARIDSERGRLGEELSSLVQLSSNLRALLLVNPEFLDVSVDTGVEKVDALMADARIRAAEREALVGSLRNLEFLGFSIEEFNGLLARCANEISEEFYQLPLKESLLLSASSDLTLRMQAANSELARLRIEKLEVESNVALKLTALVGTQDASIAKPAIEERTSSLRNFMHVFESLPETVQGRAANRLHGFIGEAKVVYQQVQSLSDDLGAAQARGREVALLVASTQSSIGTMNKLISERDNLQQAFSTLAAIKQNHSLETGVSAFLLENLASIQSIFQKIHVPNELKLCDLASSQLVRADGGRDAPLHQISTGQRAAFVLSIFLTLNMSLKSGPPIMLVDDPISHVDDLNSLAFLDYLADIAESGRRQVFFATADEKVANLFEKKMAFLGDGLKVVPLARVSETQ